MVINSMENCMDKNVTEELKRMLWAKSDPFKPLIVHLIEVGAVAQTLLNNSVFFPILLELCKRASLSKDQATALVGYLAAVHDIGKIHPSLCCIKTGNPRYPHVFIPCPFFGRKKTGVGKEVY